MNKCLRGDATVVDATVLMEMPLRLIFCPLQWTGGRQACQTVRVKRQSTCANRKPRHLELGGERWAVNSGLALLRLGFLLASQAGTNPPPCRSPYSPLSISLASLIQLQLLPEVLLLTFVGLCQRLLHPLHGLVKLAALCVSGGQGVQELRLLESGQLTSLFGVLQRLFAVAAFRIRAGRSQPGHLTMYVGIFRVVGE